MLGAGRYLLGVAEIGAIVGFAWLGASAARARLLPTFTGLPAHLATAVLVLALLIWTAELLGTFGWFEPLPYLLVVAVVGLLLRGWRRRGRGAPCGDRTRGWEVDVATVISVAIATAAFLKFAADAKLKLSTGMTGFDSTWYHGTFAAGFMQSGNTWGLHFIAPQFLAWFYPANAEVLHAVGMNAFGRDILSPLLNLGWFIGCLVACWCIGRPYRVGSWSLALGAMALSVPALSDQAGEARNDIVGIFFLLAAVAIAVNAWAARGDRERCLPTGALLVTGLAAGLAAGTKLNFLLPVAVLVVGLVAIAPAGKRWHTILAAGLPALAGGGYWYLRNLIHTGNPLPWFDHLGPISLPAPAQELGGREEHSVLGYLADGSVWSDWLLPGLHDGLGLLWPLLAGLALAGLVLNLGRGAGPVLRVSALVGLAAMAAWLVAPTSASGPEGMPRGFESGLRYLAPALVLGMALLPTVPQLRDRLQSLGSTSLQSASNSDAKSRFVRLRPAGVFLGLVVLAAAVGYPVQRDYLRDRYANPTFTTPGLNAAFRWARSVEDARIGTTSTRQYPLFGTDLSNRVEFVGEERPHGGFVAPASCLAWRRAVNAGDYDYVIVSRDRIEPGKPAYPPSAGWTEGPEATVVLRKLPTVIFKLKEPLDPSGCG
ncbi:MAG TPA: hypothetical protein VIE64_08350 [Solirubrobacterales bacterium]|jgi:hypothetical protein